ncbi:PEPxxWA-CTERM sorting domain-containing protein [Polymorphobacter megasporae]|uniref:PEPxxWA-CTERM sorting domain-containing protein n=1 Tax=Glacieibacterium megasporae TaxID=2835787 RepID=UPI002107C650|nr:PEPxxWA-CTERM sorting domain-containing protein [Polymorphobacter megasporae]
MFRLMIFAGLALAIPSIASPVEAGTVIVPGENAALESEHNANSPFGNTSSSGFVTQIAYGASQLSSVAVGTMITGIGFRMYSEYESNDQDLNYTSFDIQVGTSSNTIAGLSRTFDNNLGGDTITARSGALSIAAGTFIGDQTYNPFYTISFTTPYAYQGGDLLITIRDTLADDTVGAFVPLDAVSHSATLGSVGTTGSATAIKGFANFFYIPVTQLTFVSTAVPEPASWLLMIVGFGLVGSALRQRSFNAARIG